MSGGGSCFVSRTMLLFPELAAEVPIETGR